MRHGRRPDIERDRAHRLVPGRSRPRSPASPSRCGCRPSWPRRTSPSTTACSAPRRSPCEPAASPTATSSPARARCSSRSCGSPTSLGLRTANAPRVLSLAAALVLVLRHLRRRPGRDRSRRRAPRRRPGERHRRPRSGSPGRSPPTAPPWPSPPRPMAMVLRWRRRGDRAPGGVDRARHRRHRVGEGPAGAGDRPRRPRAAGRPAARPRSWPAPRPPSASTSCCGSPGASANVWDQSYGYHLEVASDRTPGANLGQGPQHDGRPRRHRAGRGRPGARRPSLLRPPSGRRRPPSDGARPRPTCCSSRGSAPPLAGAARSSTRCGARTCRSSSRASRCSPPATGRRGGSSRSPGSCCSPTTWSTPGPCCTPTATAAAPPRRSTSSATCPTTPSPSATTPASCGAAGHRTPPDLVDASVLRIQTGDITSDASPRSPAGRRVRGRRAQRRAVGQLRRPPRPPRRAGYEIAARTATSARLRQADCRP